MRWLSFSLGPVLKRYVSTSHLHTYTHHTYTHHTYTYPTLTLYTSLHTLAYSQVHTSLSLVHPHKSIRLPHLCILTSPYVSLTCASSQVHTSPSLVHPHKSTRLPHLCILTNPHVSFTCLYLIILECLKPNGDTVGAENSSHICRTLTILYLRHCGQSPCLCATMSPV